MKPSSKNIILHCSPPALKELGVLLQEGFFVNVMTGVTVRKTLTLLGFTDTYINERIQTIFLNFRPLDDLDGTTTAPGDTLSLSGAMPGLVGAVMRVGSYLAPFRKNISENTRAEKIRSATGLLKIKIFNLILRDSGTGFLERGILLAPRQLQDFFSRRDEEFFKGCSQLTAGGRVLVPGPLVIQEAAPGQELIEFRAVTGDADIKMKVTVKLFASLQENRFDEKVHTCHEGITIQMLIDELSLPADKVAVIFINNTHAQKDQAVNNGDRVSFFPPVGGG